MSVTTHLSFLSILCLTSYLKEDIKMKVFFDTEFTGLKKDTSLISIGCISENGDQFYAELDDFNKHDVNEWMKENVFKHTIRVGPNGYFNKSNIKLESTIINASKKSTVCYGGRGKVSFAIKDWLKIIGGQENGIEFVSDVCHYDMVLMVDLLTDGKTALDLPEWIGAACYDINQDIAWVYNIDERTAFEKSRELVAEDLWPSYPFFNTMKHNALYDAEVISVIYKVIEMRRGRSYDV